MIKYIHRRYELIERESTQFRNIHTARAPSNTMPNNILCIDAADSSTLHVTDLSAHQNSQRLNLIRHW